MLAEARNHHIYGSLRYGVLGEPLDYPTGVYDATLASGVFGVGHAPASGWDEVARIVQSGGYFILTLPPDIFETLGYKAKEEELVSAGRCELVETTEP